VFSCRDLTDSNNSSPMMPRLIEHGAQQAQILDAATDALSGPSGGRALR
jgi:hypothetical protein